MDRRIFIGAGAVAALGVGAWTVLRGSGSDNIEGNAETGQPVDDSGIIEMTLGSPDAPVKLTEYASYTCPHCRSFHQGAFKQLKADYIDTGKVFFTYREVYFDKFGLWAAAVARCGGEARYFGISDMLYEQQPEWMARGQSELEIVENLRSIGRTAGISDAELDACLGDADMMERMVAVYQRNAEADDISSTPSFVIDGEKHRNMSYDDMRAILDDKIGS